MSQINLIKRLNSFTRIVSKSKFETFKMAFCNILWSNECVNLHILLGMLHPICNILSEFCDIECWIATFFWVPNVEMQHSFGYRMLHCFMCKQPSLILQRYNLISNFTHNTQNTSVATAKVQTTPHKRTKK